MHMEIMWYEYEKAYVCLWVYELYELYRLYYDMIILYDVIMTIVYVMMELLGNT